MPIPEILIDSVNGPMLTFINPNGTTSSSLYIDSNNNLTIMSGSVPLSFSSASYSAGAGTASYVPFTSIANAPSLISSSAQVSYGQLTGVPSGIVSASNQVTFSNLSGVPSGLVSASGQVVYGNLSGVPSGIVSASNQVTFGGLSGVPTGLVSASAQVLVGSTIISSSAQISGLGAGIVSASNQISFVGITNVPVGLVSSSNQVLVGSNIISGSSQIAGLGSGIVSSSAQVSYVGLSNIPVGIVSSSAQVLVGSGLYSSSAQLPVGLISSSLQFKASDNVTFGVVTASTLLVSTLIATTISSSVEYASGSNRFGSTITNTHQFTGSVFVTGSLSVVGPINGSLVGTASWSSNTTSASYSVSSSFASNSTSASFAQQSISSSFATFAPAAGTANTASYVVLAQTASFVQQAVSASFVATASWSTNAVTASFVSGRGVASVGFAEAISTFTTSVSSANTFTNLAYDSSATTDTTDWTYSATAGSTFTCKTAATYRISVSVFVQKTGGTATVGGIRLTKNGVEIAGSFNAYTFASNNVLNQLSSTVIEPLAVNDVIGVQLIGGTTSVQMVQVPAIGSVVTRPSSTMQISRI